MSKNPKIVPCPANEWEKVASAITRGGLTVLSTKAIYLWTYRVAGDKTEIDQDEGIRFDGSRVEIDAKSPIDLYVKSMRDVGLIRVDDLG